MNQVVKDDKQSAEYFASNPDDIWIETVSGKHFYFESSQFDLDDGAHAIGMQCRYTGHCKKFYSVAEHSVLVSDLMLMFSLGDPFEGLMHDFHEGWFTDIATPWKGLLPDYSVKEKQLEARMRKQFGLPDKITSGAKLADRLALYLEASELIPSKGADWNFSEEVMELGRRFQEMQSCSAVVSYSPKEATMLFKGTYNEYRPN